MLKIPRRSLLQGISAASVSGFCPAIASQSTVDVIISAGQSWRSIAFPSFGRFGIDPSSGDVRALQVQVGRQNVNSRLEPLPNGSGVWIPGEFKGTTTYAPGDRVSIGRCAAFAQQIFRRRAGRPVTPILEFCMAYPGSSWDAGPKQGLGPGTVPWDNGLRLMSAVEQFVAMPTFRSVGWTQGGSKRRTAEEFTQMTEAYDSLKLPGTSTQPLNFYVGLRSGVSNDSDLTRHPQFDEIYKFCRRNQNGRTWGTTPWYQWPFSGPGDAGYGNVHTGPYGTVRHGEVEGYARFVVEDEGEGRYYPLWRSLTQPMTLVNEHTIKVPFDRPSGRAFQHSKLDWSWEGDDGIAKAFQYGWQVKVDGSFVATQPSLDGLNVYLSANSPIPLGRTIEVSYAMFGPTGSNPGLHAAALGNLMMAGPPSAFFAGKTLNTWAWQFSEAIVF